MPENSLELGEVLHVEVRDPSGTITDYSHDYPIDASRLLRMPSIRPVLVSEGTTLTDLRNTIADVFVTDVPA